MTTKNFLFILFFVFLVTGGFYLYKTNLENKNNTPLTVETNTPTTEEKSPNLTTDNSVNYTLPEGDQTYNVSHGKETTGPKMNQIVFSPLSFKAGDNQKIKIVFPEKEQVGSVVVFVTTDNKESQKVTFNKDSKLNTWSGEWTTNDSVKTRYSIKIVAVGAAGEYNNIMKFL